MDYNLFLKQLIINHKLKKKKKLLLFAMLLSTVVMTSCSKDSANPTLVGKWQFVSYDYKIGTISAPMNVTAADYVEFKTNGTVLTSISGQSKSVPYSINGSNVTIDGELYSISTLTSSNATLYNTSGTGISKIEVTIILKK